VYVSLLLLIYHLLSTQELCEKRLNEKEKKETEKKNEGIRIDRENERERVKANSIVVVATTRCHF
jgi:hypothetical protein